MADDVATPAAAPEAPAEAAAPEAAAPAGGKPKAGSPELARWHGDRAQAAIREAQAGEETPAVGTPERDPTTGKFLKPKAKAKTRADVGPSGPHKPAPSGATPEPATKEKPPVDGAVPDSIAAVRRLASEGKLEEAFRRAFGRTPEELLNSKAWAAWRSEAKNLKTATEAKTREADQKEAQLRQLQAELSAEFKPMHDARKALQEGDLDKAFQLFAGTDFNTFSRNFLRQSTGPNVGKDPAFLSLQKELEQTRREMQEYRQREQEQTKQQRQEQAQREYVQNMVTELEASDDPRIARAAKRPGFQRKVLQIEQEHYDPATDWTIPHAEAAQLAIEALASEYGEWGDVFGGSASRPEPRGESRTPPTRAATPAKPTTRVVTTLSQKEAAEAASEPKLKGKALVEKYVKLHDAMMFRNGIG